MNHRALIATAAVASLALPGIASAQNVGTGFEPDPRTTVTQVGTRGANVLRIGSDARIRSMADAGTALVEGAAALPYNPSAAAIGDGIQAAASWSNLYGDLGVGHGYLGMTFRLGSAGAVGVHTVFFGSGEFEPTTERTPQGNDPRMGEAMEWTGMAGGLTYAHQITDRLALGATGKLVQEGIEFARSDWLALDLGATFDTGIYGVRMAMAITNISGQSRFEGAALNETVDRDDRLGGDILGSDLMLNYNTNGVQLPTAFRLALQSDIYGAATSVLGPGNGQHGLNVVTEISDGFDTDIQTRLGLEYSFADRFFLRGGKYFMNEARSPWEGTDGMSAGAGVRVGFLGRTLGLDYAYTSMGLLDNVQTFSFQLGS